MNKLKEETIRSAGVRASLRRLVALGLLLTTLGCGSTKSRTATEQLLMSDAVDRAVAQIDFTDLAGQKIFFDTKYIVNTKDPQFIGNQKGLGFVNAEYVIGSLRQQMVAADCRLQEKVEDADFVVEARLGAVGVDNNEVIYGMPASQPYSAAATAMGSVPPIPALPEIAIAKKIIQVGAAKVGVFAYDRRTKGPVWQAGLSQAMSDAKDSWILGIGPFQRGTIYKGTQFAGSKLRVPALTPLPSVDQEMEPAGTDAGNGLKDPLRENGVSYSEEFLFRRLTPQPESPIHQASGLQPVAAGQEPKLVQQAGGAATSTSPNAAAPGGAPVGSTTPAAGVPNSGATNAGTATGNGSSSGNSTSGGSTNAGGATSGPTTPPVGSAPTAPAPGAPSGTANGGIAPGAK